MTRINLLKPVPFRQWTELPRFGNCKLKAYERCGQNWRRVGNQPHVGIQIARDGYYIVRCFRCRNYLMYEAL